MSIELEWRELDCLEWYIILSVAKPDELSILHKKIDFPCGINISDFQILFLLPLDYASEMLASTFSLLFYYLVMACIIIASVNQITTEMNEIHHS